MSDHGGNGETYRGDTVGKKIARYAAWERMLAARASDERGAQRALYLASHEGGDASVLACLGIPPEHHLAVDYDGEALAAFKAKWPTVPTVFGDVGELKIPAHERFRFVCLDFCSHLNDSVIQTILNVILHCGHTKYFMLTVAFMRGREKAAERAEIEKKKARPAGTVTLNTDASRGLRGAEDGRLDYLMNELNVRLQRHSIMCHLTEVITYQSRTTLTHGVPMAYAVMYVTFIPQMKGKPNWWLSPHNRDIYMTQFVHGLHGKAKRRAVRAGMTNVVTTATAEQKIWRLECYDVSGYWEERHLREYALMLSEDGMDASEVGLALNVDPQSVAAWKAHETRGTYEAHHVDMSRVPPKVVEGHVERREKGNE